MVEQTVTVKNRAGVHTRPAAMIVKLAAQFKSDISFIGENSMRINAKSIIGVMTLAAAQGTDLHIITNGADETDALSKMVALFDSGFGEPL
ncbi:MAG: HPr family phosphocarrier protein [Candidatus Kapabacteria bacterium]|nr:HPr family phosphocarrier protein [Candidatus Kapabacteria bacterium]